MEGIQGNYHVPNTSIKKTENTPVKPTNQAAVQKSSEPKAKASAANVAAYYQNIKVPSPDELLDIQMKKGATLPNGGYVFRNELDGGKAIVKNNTDGSYQVILIRDLAAKPEAVVNLSKEEFFMNPDLCSGFVVPKSDGTYDVTLLNPSNKEEMKLFGTNNMKKSELIKLMEERYFN